MSLAPYLAEVAAREPVPGLGDPTSIDLEAAFNQGVRFLADPARMPNLRINTTASAMGRLLQTDHLGIMLVNPDVTDGISFHSGIQTWSGGQTIGRTSTLEVPKDFQHRTKADPIRQLGALVAAGHHARMAVAGAIDRPDMRDHILPQSSALVADLVLTLQQMVADENISYEFSDLHNELVEEHPNGFGDISTDGTFGNYPVEDTPQNLTTDHVNLLGQFDYISLTSEHTPDGPVIRGLLDLLHAGVPGLITIEQVLRSTNSPVFLLAVAEGNVAAKQEFALRITKDTGRPRTHPQNILRAMGVSAEVNRQQLSNIGK